jgi:type II secretory pathway pseudopilin PulG
MKLRRSHSGYTLLEILLATAIFMTIIVIATAIFTTTTSSSSASDQLRLASQAARFAFESMTRETRLARGLVVVADEKQKMIIPPFATTGNVVTIYQTTNVGRDESGENLYTVSRKVYELEDGKLTVKTENTGETGQSVDAIACGAALTPSCPEEKRGFWRSADPTKPAENVTILPKSLKVADFRVIRAEQYPLLKNDKSLDDLKVQPFVQLEMIVQNIAYNPASKNDKNLQTTLRSMIVPRDFVSKYEVTQPGQKGSE